MALETAESPLRGEIRKKLNRRVEADGSQRMRRAVQWAFVALNCWIGVQFYLWVRFVERGGAGLHVARPAGAEGWLPIIGLMNVKYLLATGQVPGIHPAAMFLLLAFLVMGLTMKKAFCGWLCPVGTLSECLWMLGRKMFTRNARLPRWADLPLRGMKYLLLGFFVIGIGTMPAAAVEDFMSSPYGLNADVKMLNFFREIGFAAALVICLLIVFSMVVQNFWCRYLCPYGALLGLASLLSPLKIRRDGEACIDCGKCARACPAHLPVDALAQIRSAECTACMACVAACPAQDALQLALPPRAGATARARWRKRAMNPRLVVLGLACIFFAFVLLAKATGHWQTNPPQGGTQTDPSVFPSIQSR